MSKVYARDYTLLRIARDTQWGFVQTNDYGSTGKSHLLEMRRKDKGWVKNVSWDHPQVLKSGIRAHYSDKLAFYYCITFKGLIHLLETFPDKDILKKMKIILFDKVFTGEDKEWINFRL